MEQDSSRKLLAVTCRNLHSLWHVIGRFSQSGLGWFRRLYMRLHLKILAADNDLIHVHRLSNWLK